MTRVTIVLLALAVAALLPLRTATAARQPHPLFVDSEPLRITIRAPLATIRQRAERATTAHEGLLTLEGPIPESHAIRLSARGLNRRRQDICTFPPLRVEFISAPSRRSHFSGQRRLKLVTHCRAAESFQQHALLEYAAYRLLNVLSPISLRVRLAIVDY